MRLLSLELENFRGFQQLKLDFAPPQNDVGGKGGLTAFIAENGQGKTAILEAVRYLLGTFIARFPKTSVPRLKDSDYRDEWCIQDTGRNALRKKIRKPFMRLKAEAEFETARTAAWDIVVRRDKSAKTAEALKGRVFLGSAALNAEADRFIDRDNEEHPIPYPIFAYYNTERAVIRNKPERRRGFQREFHRTDAYVGALDSGLNYKKIIEWFCCIEHIQDQEMKAQRNWDYQSLETRTIQLAVEKMLPGFRNIRTVSNPLDLVIDVEDEDGTVKVCRIDSQLSDGYKCVLVLVLDLVSRIIEANGMLPDMTPDKLLDAEGVVLIDEVDLHLHPSWQQRILPDLCRTFPNIQFIVTTHSPQVLSSIPKECVRVLCQGEILPASMQTHGVASNEILAQVFGTHPSPRTTPFSRMLEEYAQLSLRGDAETEEGTALYQKLAKHFGPDYLPLMHIENHRKFLANRREDGDAQVHTR